MSTIQALPQQTRRTLSTTTTTTTTTTAAAALLPKKGKKESGASKSRDNHKSSTSSSSSSSSSKKKKRTRRDDSDSDNSDDESDSEQQQQITTAATTHNEERILHPYLDYLKQWKQRSADWHHRKTVESKIMHHFDMVTLITPAYFAILLEYIDTMRGNARKRLFDLAYHKLQEQREQAKKDALELLSFKSGKKIKTQKADSLLTEDMISAQLRDNAKAQRARAVLEALVLTDSKNGIDLNEETRQVATATKAAKVSAVLSGAAKKTSSSNAKASKDDDDSDSSSDSDTEMKDQDSDSDDA